MSALTEPCGCEIAPTQDRLSGLRVLFCPLHAEAEAMRDVLARLVATVDQVFPEARGLFSSVEEARPILARIDGDTPDA